MPLELANILAERNSDLKITHDKKLVKIEKRLWDTLSAWVFIRRMKNESLHVTRMYRDLNLAIREREYVLAYMPHGIMLREVESIFLKPIDEFWQKLFSHNYWQAPSYILRKVYAEGFIQQWPIISMALWGYYGTHRDIEKHLNEIDAAGKLRGYTLKEDYHRIVANTLFAKNII